MSGAIILMYHMISEPKTSLERRYACTPKRFRSHIRFLREGGYNLISLKEYDKMVSSNEQFPPKTTIITFDDGFRDNYENAFPILQEYRVPATIFLVSGLIDKHNQWMNRESFTQRRMMSWKQVKEMYRYGVEFGSHTVSHPDLTLLQSEDIRTELRGSKALIEDLIGSPVDHFAYPYGLVSASVKDQVLAAGYTLACSTRPGFNSLDTDRSMCRRLEVYGNDSVRSLQRKICFGTNDSSLTLPLKYYWRRACARLSA